MAYSYFLNKMKNWILVIKNKVQFIPKIMTLKFSFVSVVLTFWLCNSVGILKVSAVVD